MPDIAMCRGEGCPVAKYCWRATATPSERRQAYFSETPKQRDDGSGCMYFLGNGAKEEEP